MGKFDIAVEIGGFVGLALIGFFVGYKSDLGQIWLNKIFSK